MNRSTLYAPAATTSSDFPAYGDAAEPRAHESHVAELSPGLASERAVRERHASFAAALRSLENAAGAFDAYDPSTQAASRALQGRLVLLRRAGDSAVSTARAAAEHGALDGAVAPFLAGAYLWLDGALGALASLADALNAMQPDWVAFRTSLAEVSWLYEMTMAEHARVDDSRGLESLALRDAADDLLCVLVALKASLDARFG